VVKRTADRAKLFRTAEKIKRPDHANDVAGGDRDASTGNATDRQCSLQELRRQTGNPQRGERDSSSSRVLHGLVTETIHFASPVAKSLRAFPDFTVLENGSRKRSHSFFLRVPRRKKVDFRPSSSHRPDAHSPPAVNRSNPKPSCDSHCWMG